MLKSEKESSPQMKRVIIYSSSCFWWITIGHVYCSCNVGSSFSPKTSEDLEYRTCHMNLHINTILLDLRYTHLKDY